MTSKVSKERVDVLLVQQGLCETREKAKRTVMAGLVCDEKNIRYDKPGEKIPTTTELRLKGQVLKYVSRGGLKLEKAIKVFGIDFSNKRLLDIGSSTGGFTDVALQNGAMMSYALDVGSNQLAWKLRQDNRVEVMEKTNFRYSKLSDFTLGQPNIATIDVSFISLKLIIPVLREIISEDGEVVALIKPQFEAGKNQVGKKGIVRDRKVHEEVLQRMIEMMTEARFDVLNLDFSPITGGEGNIEFLAYLRPSKEIGTFLGLESTRELVERAHTQLNG